MDYKICHEFFREKSKFLPPHLLVLIRKIISANELVSEIILISLFLFIFIPMNLGQVYINEFLASNVATNPDNHDFDDYSDWLELYNAGDEPVGLGGYFLTDNLNQPAKWLIPANTIIEAKGFLFFWADGRDDVPGKSYIGPWTTQWGPGLQERFTLY